MAFWKISHGAGFFAENGKDNKTGRDLWKEFRDKNLIVVGGEYECSRLRSINKDDYFYLTYGNKNGEGIQLLGQVIGDCQDCTIKGNGWLQREYKVIQDTIKSNKIYDGDSRGWTPNYQSTIYKVPESEESLFEANILIPYFGKTIADLTGSPPNKPKNIDLNTILYGPPGTGKTYNSVNYAVAICEGKNLKDVEAEDYKDVFKRYNDLKK